MRRITGAGKSIVAKSIAAQLHKDKSLATSFFFSQDDPAKRELEQPFRATAFQLAQCDAEYRVCLSGIIKDCSDVVHAGPNYQHDKLILTPPSDPKVILRSDRSWVILWDALDECNYTFLQFLTPELHRFPKHIRILLTGRPVSLARDRPSQPFTCSTIRRITMHRRISASTWSIRFWLRVGMKETDG